MGHSMEHAPLLSLGFAQHFLLRDRPELRHAVSRLPLAALISNATQPDGSGRLAAVLEKLRRPIDCCIRFVVVGASSCIGAGIPQAIHLKGAAGINGTWTRALPGVETAGLNRTYGAYLARWLDRATSPCCRGGHSFLNLCRGGTGTQYILDSVLPVLASAHRGETPIDLVLVDTLDWNNALDDLRHKVRAAEEAGQVVGRTEALVRRLLALQPNLAVLPVQTYWMLVRNNPATGRVWQDNRLHALYGTWDMSGRVYRHYRLPTVNMPAALDGLAAPPLTLPASHPLSFNRLKVDPNHISHDGHLLAALFLAGALLAEAARPAHGSAAGQLTLPDDVPILSPPEHRSSLAAEQTLIDFTLPSPLRRPREMEAEGWAWITVHRNEGSAGYRPERGAAPQQSIRREASYFGTEDANFILGALQGDNFNKRGFRADDAGANTTAVFRTPIQLVLGQLRLSYLKSYQGQAAAAVELLGCNPPLAASPKPKKQGGKERPGYCGVRNDCWRLDGAWNDRVSVSWTDTLAVPLAASAPRAAGPGGPVNCTLQMTALFSERPPPHRGAHIDPTSFTLYSIASL